MAKTAICFLVLALLATRSGAADSDAAELGNWYNDPFFQVRTSFADCPTPLGPFITRQQATQQEHYRAERGTSCYLSGECKYPNAYLYDPDIGSTVREIFADHPELAAHSSLWVTVSRRFVYVEGCSDETQDMVEIERLIRMVPDMQTVLLNVAIDPRNHVPYQSIKK